MKTNSLRRLTGVLFVLGAILVNIPYFLLITNFNYPDILREPPGVILTQFQQGGTGLIFTWFAFAWMSIPLFFAIILLQKVLEREEIQYLGSATLIGLIGAIAQMVGLLRWVFVVPVLAQNYTHPGSSAAAREAITVAFQVVHQFGGVLLGEHIGQTFTILWMFLISLALLRSHLSRSWLSWLGIVASFVYLLAQTELFATIIPDFPIVPEAGLLGSLLWLGWMICLGVTL